MKYISLDLEATGLDPVNDKILSIGAIIEDTNKKLPYDELPKFHAIIRHHRISGSPFAINMNKDIIDKMVAYDDTDEVDRLTMIENGDLYLYEDVSARQPYESSVAGHVVKI